MGCDGKLEGDWGLLDRLGWDADKDGWVGVCGGTEMAGVNE